MKPKQPKHPMTKVRGFDWRMSRTLKNNVKAYCEEHGLTYTEFLERACTLYLFEKEGEK